MKILVTEEQLSNVIQSDESMAFDWKNGTYRWTNDKKRTNIDTSRTSRDDQGKVKLRFIPVTLPHSQVKTYNLFDINQFNVTQALKHGKGERNGISTTMIPEDSIEEFKDYTAKYILRILNHENKIIDIILTPQSSSNFNVDISNRVKNFYQKDYNRNIEVLPNALIKTPEAAKIDMTKSEEPVKNDLKKYYPHDTQEQLQQKFTVVMSRIHDMADNWELEGKLKPFADLINNLYRTKNALLNAKIVAPADKKIIQDIDAAVNGLVKQWNNDIGEQINNTKYFKKGKYQTDPKPFQIKHLTDGLRRSITNLFAMTKEFDKPYGNDQSKVSKLIDRLKRNNKSIMIFDDNLSSGATMDNIAEHLIQNGINKDNIIIFTLGVVPPSTYNPHEPLYKGL